MQALVVVTSEDLGRQKLQGLDVEREIRNPGDVLDPALAAHIAGMRNPLVFEYDGVKVFERQSGGYPNPTLNHFNLAGYMKDQQVPCRRLVDLGCGVGFLGNFGAVKLESEEVVFSDLNPEAVNQSLAAYQVNTGIDLAQAQTEQHATGARFNTGRHTLDARVGNAAQTLLGYEADVAVAAPMYIPGVCEVFPQAFDIFAGIARNMGATLYVAHSNLANSLVQAAAERQGMQWDVKHQRSVQLLLEYGDSRASSGVQVQTGRLLPDVESRLCRLGLEVGEGGGRPFYGHKMVVSALHK